MLLSVDIGNTQTLLGLYAGAELCAHWRIATVSTDTDEEIMVKLRGLFELCDYGLDDVDDIAIASVVPLLTKLWQNVAEILISTKVLVVGPDTDTGLPIHYSNPAEIGADRLADAVAAIAHYGAPVIVVDFGTATNIEVIDKGGAFVGGIIAPGLTTSAEALFRAAARLPKIDVAIPDTVIGTNTNEAVQSGLTFGEIDRIDGLIVRVFEQLGYEAPVIATGGLSSQVVGLSRMITATDDYLTLEGLRLLHLRTHEG